MRYPFGKSGTRGEVEKNWYVAQGFGEKTNYGYHEGADWNLKTGGDTDLGEPLYAIADWEIAYYHLKSHLESGFGEHFVYQVESPWGVRWVHYCHNQNSIDPQKKNSGKKGDKIAEIGKSGRPRNTLPAHLHLAIFKVDPSILPNGIDTIAKSKTQLNDWWEDPVAFLNKWNDYKQEGIMDIKQLAYDIRMGLFKHETLNKDYKIQDSELEYDVREWKGAQDFMQRITGDSNFHKVHIQPQLDGQKIALESVYNLEKDALINYWQSNLESAKKDYEERLKKQLEDKDPYELLVIAIKRILGR